MAPASRKKQGSQTISGDDAHPNRGAAANTLALTIANAEAMKVRGNSFFRQGRFKDAVEQYRNALNELMMRATGPCLETTPLVVTLQSNLAACFLEMAQYEQAVDWARAAVCLDPLHLKSYRKLCKAQHLLKWMYAAVETMSIVVALSLPNRLDDDMLPIFHELAGAKPLPPTSSDLQFGYQLLPGDVGEYACAASDREVQQALAAKKKVVVLKPGVYSGNCLGPALQLDYSLTLLGLGKVDITSGASGHALHLLSGQLHARHLNLKSDTPRSAICVGSEHANLLLIESTVEDHKGQGLLITGGQAYLQGCTFRNLGKQAVEVRGGSVRLLDCHINKCCQGVAISGGLRLVEIIDCRIEDVSREGLSISGKRRRESINVEFGLEELRANLPDAARREVDSTLLEVRIVDCVVKGCRSYGLLLDDMDANVSIVNSKLVDNDPAACYVKGGTTVLLDKCEIEVDKDRTGLSVGINYDATVTSTGNKFVVVDRKSAMVEEVSAGGGAGFCRRIINRDNLVVVQQASRSRAPTKSKGVSALKQMKHAFRVDRSEARARSLQQMTQTSRRVLHAARNLGVFCGVRDSTFGTDLSLGQDLSTIPVDKDAPRTIRILMGACGDIRNLLKTVFSLKQYPDLLVQVVCNDWNLAILARTIVLFSLIEQGTSADDVLAIWANDALTSSQREQLDKILILLASSLPEWVVCLRERSSHLGAELLGIFASWRDWELTLEDLDNLHAESISDEWKHMVVDFGSGSVGNIHADNHNNQQVFTFNGKRSKAMKSANILFLEAPSLKYTLHWASSICSAINLEESDSTGSSSSRSSASRLESTGPEGLYELLMRTISIDEINALAVMFKQGALHVGVMNSNILDGMLHGDCLELLHKLNRQPQHPTRTPPPLFDFIDLSDSADYLSMPAVVQAGLTLLKVEKHASLHINSFTWGMSFDTRQPLEFLKCSIGMELDTYKELLGVSVQTQVVGSSRLPILQTQWTWDLHGNQEATLTGAMVLLELMMAVKLHCAIDRIKYISNEGVRLNSDGMVAGFMGGIEYSSPLTLLHLIHQRFPDIALQIISVLICANDTFECRKWELIHHFMSQHEPKMTPYTFFPAYFQGNVQYTTLLACPEAPLCLMVSGAPVRVTRSSPVEVHAANVLYLLEAFSYSIESDRVEVLLPLEYLNQYRHYFVTLCAVTNATKLQALGSSVPWTEIKVRMDQAPFTAWTPCKRLAQRALLPDGLFSDGIELEEFMGKILAKGNATGQSWKTHAVLETRTHVIVQLLTPGPLPLPGSDNVTITVTMVGSSLKVVAANASNRQKRGSMTFRDQEHTVQLPAAVSFAERRLKLSRKLGIMIVHLPKVAVVSA